MKTYKIAVVNGDGVGHEIVPAGIKVMNKVAEKHGFKLEYESFPWGAGYYKEHGDFMPANGLEILGGFDAIYFGAVGLPDVDDTLPAMMYTLKVRSGFSQYVNYRPVKLLKGTESPLRNKVQKDIDFIVILPGARASPVATGKLSSRGAGPWFRRV